MVSEGERSHDEEPRSDRNAAEQALAVLADRLLEVVVPAIGPWVREAIALRQPEGSVGPDPALVDQAAERATLTIGEQLRLLLGRDIAEQQANPLSVLRGVVPFAGEVLLAAGVPPVDRDDQARRLHPDDRYDLTPASFSDFGDAAQRAGLMWGAAKAHLHLRRRAELAVNG